MKIFPQKRIDSILIWGHGMEKFNEILSDIRINKDFNIIKIQKHKPKSIKKFVREIYSYDYAPFWHLQEKTKYLLKMPKEVCFIFLENLNPKEDYLGEGSFRHKESLTLKSFKDKLRKKYNPYEKGKMTHNHVVHATDSQSQAEHILRYLDYKDGAKYFDRENRFIDLPYYIKGYSNFEFKLINTEKLFCKTISGKSWDNFTSRIIRIKESPQYRGLSEDMNLYKGYIDKYIGGPLQDNYDVNRYKKIFQNFEYLKKPYQNSFVIVEKKDSKYIVLDGLHRSCCHIYQGNKEIKVCQISR